MKTIDISGMGGGYENECQKMVWAGVEFLKKEPGEIKFKQNANVHGLIDTSEDDRTARLETHIAEASGDCTGGMVHSVMQHLWFISKNGVEKWLGEFHDQPDRVYEWDGTVGTCPKTELSQKMEQSPVQPPLRRHEPVLDDDDDSIVPAVVEAVVDVGLSLLGGGDSGGDSSPSSDTGGDWGGSGGEFSGGGASGDF